MGAARPYIYMYVISKLKKLMYVFICMCMYVSFRARKIIDTDNC